MGDFSHNQMLSSLCSERICKLLKETQLESLNQKHFDEWLENAKFEEQNKDEIIALRQLYPELHELSNATLYYMYDRYMQDCEYIGGWGEPDSRTNCFIFYVLGKNVDYEFEGHDAKEIGKKFITELLDQ